MFCRNFFVMNLLGVNQSKILDVDDIQHAEGIKEGLVCVKITELNSLKEFQAQANKSQKFVKAMPNFPTLKSTSVHAHTFSCSAVKCPITQRCYILHEVRRQTAGQIRCHI